MCVYMPTHTQIGNGREMESNKERERAKGELSETMKRPNAPIMGLSDVGNLDDPVA